MPFNNFHSIQETRDRDRTMADTMTNGTIQHPGSDHNLSLSKKLNNQKSDVIATSLQTQIDSLQSSMQLLLEKYDSMETRTQFNESNIQSVLDKIAL